MKFQRIQDLRVDSDLSQRQIGEILHISQRTYLTTKQDPGIFLSKCLSELQITIISVLTIWLAAVTGRKKSE